MSSSLPQEMQRELDLHQQFKAKFGKSPTVDHDRMPHDVWMAQVEQALKTGEVPERLANLMGYSGDVVR